MFYLTIEQKLAISLVLIANLVNILYFLEKLKMKSVEKYKDKLAEASRLTNEARNLLIKSKQIQEEFLLDDTTFEIPEPSSGISSNESKRNVKGEENVINTLLILGEDGEFIESIRFTDKDYVQALNSTKSKNILNFMKKCFK